MTPLTVNPNITILTENGRIVEVATNVAPDLKVTVTSDPVRFGELKLGKSFVFTPEPVDE